VGRRCPTVAVKALGGISLHARSGRSCALKPAARAPPRRSCCSFLRMQAPRPGWSVRDWPACCSLQGPKTETDSREATMTVGLEGSATNPRRRRGNRARLNPGEQRFPRLLVTFAVLGLALPAAAQPTGGD